jgi:putative ABC transport system ATP-binding protein
MENVSKFLAGRRVLDNISFELPRGKLLAVIGPSGSGKSTLLRTVNRLIEIDSGKILVSGESIRKKNPVKLRRRIGLVAQTPAMFTGSVHKNIRYGLDLQNRYNKKTVLKALEDAELNSEYLFRDASKLSVGEKQRVAIARALVLEPEVLLLDEPTSALDAKITKRFESTIKHLKASRGLTIIWVTHDLRQAERVGDIGAVIQKGKLKKFGKPSTIFSHRNKLRSVHKGGGK